MKHLPWLIPARLKDKCVNSIRFAGKSDERRLFLPCAKVRQEWFIKMYYAGGVRKRRAVLLLAEAEKFALIKNVFVRRISSYMIVMGVVFRQQFHVPDD